MPGAGRGDRWSAEAVAQMVGRIAPGMRAPLALHARDGTAMLGLCVGVGEHVRLWRMLRSEYERSGWWPVLAQDDPAAVCCAPPLVTQTPSQILGEAAAEADQLFTAMIDAQAWRVGFGDWWTGPDDQLPPLAALAEHLGPGPVRARPGCSRFNTHLAAPATWLYLVPAAGFEIPALWCLPWTPNWIWHDRRGPLSLTDHVGVLRSWQQRYGAELIYLCRCALELMVQRPPTEPLEIARVAMQQYAYCYDLNQYIGNVDEVALEQVATDRWYFWWD